MPAPSKAIAKDGLAFRGATTRALEQVHEAATQCATAKANVKWIDIVACATEETHLAEAEEDSSSRPRSSLMLRTPTPPVGLKRHNLMNGMSG